MKKRMAFLLTALLVIACVTPAFAAAGDVGFGDYKHVFIIGIDGAGAAFEKCDTPNFDRIFADNAYRHDAHTERVTISAQNWGSILTGVDYATHGFTNDSASNTVRGSDSGNNTIFCFARAAMPDAKLVSYSHWAAINHGIIENDLHVRKVTRLSDALVAEAILHDIRFRSAPTLMFAQFDDVDHAAHTYGGFSDEYYAAIEKMDLYLGEIYDALESRGLMEDSLLIVVADHGETTDGHGGTTPEESSAVLAAAGHSVNAAILPDTVHNRDVSAIALYALGIEQPSQFISSVPDGLFGESREKTVAGNPMPDGQRLLRNTAYVFLRLINLIVSPFDAR